MLCLALVGCASEEHRAALKSMEDACSVGDPLACGRIPAQRATNQNEAATNAIAGVAMVILVPIMILGAVVQAREEAGICGWGKHTYAC